MVMKCTFCAAYDSFCTWNSQAYILCCIMVVSVHSTFKHTSIFCANIVHGTLKHEFRVKMAVFAALVIMHLH